MSLNAPTAFRLGLVLAALTAAIAFSNPASAGGGCAATVYEHANFGGAARTLEGGTPFVGGYWNDRISSIVVHRGIWVFYEHANFGGAAVEYGPGSRAFVGSYWNDRISSARCVAPT